MFARVTTVHIPAAMTSEDLLRVHEKLLPGLEKMKGFNHYTALVNKQTGKTMAIVYWDSEADMRASATEASRIRAQAVADSHTSAPIVEEFEVAVHSVPPSPRSKRRATRKPPRKTRVAR